MDSGQGKLFIGGIPWETTEKKLRNYFQCYGEVVATVIMKDRDTGRPRGFGFVTFADPSVADRVARQKHTIDGRTVEAKKAVPRDELQNMPGSNSGDGQGTATSRTRRIFVGGLASTVTEDDLKKYFEQFGSIINVAIRYDHITQTPRGFGFITFDSEDGVENAIQKSFHELNDKMVEVKRAIPKELPAGSGRATGGFGGGGGRRGGNIGSGYSQGGYGGRADSRYGPSPGGRGGYPNYGVAGYGAAGFDSSGVYDAGMSGGYGSAGYGITPGAGVSGRGMLGARPVGEAAVPARAALATEAAGTRARTSYRNAVSGTTGSSTRAAVSSGCGSGGYEEIMSPEISDALWLAMLGGYGSDARYGSSAGGYRLIWSPEMSEQGSIQSMERIER